MQSEFPGVRRVVGALAFLFLCACSGGGGGSDSGRHIGLSATTLTFNAASPGAPTPASQVLTATFGDGVANIAALHTGPAIERVDVAINGTSAEITVVPSAPAAIGAGVFKATIAITGYFCGDASCSRLEAGQTQTVTASYQVSPLLNDVAPKAAIAGTSAEVVIRGVGFEAFSVQGVSFGATPATAMTIANDSEIRATHPALTAGSYPVTLDVPTHVGAVTSNATLVVVDPVPATTQTLAWPGTVGTIYSLEYDAQRTALLATTDIGGGQIVRFAYASNAWQAPTTASLANLRNAALSIDGAQLSAVTTTGITPVNPVTLAPGTAIPAPDLPTDSFVKSIAMLNTNVAIVTTGIAGSTETELYAYNVRTGEFVKLGTKLNNASARGSANGSLITLMQGDPSLTTAPTLWLARGSGTIATTAVALNQNSIPAALDRNATRFVLNGTRVFDADSGLLGTLPDTVSAVVLRPDGKRAYTFSAGDNGVRVYDISETKSGEMYTPVGDPVALSSAQSPGAGSKMAISADGNTLFIAGTTQLVVLPTPAL